MNFILGLIALAVAAYLVLWIIDLLWKCYLLIAGFVVGCWNIFYGIFRFIRSAICFGYDVYIYFKTGGYKKKSSFSGKQGQSSWQQQEKRSQQSRMQSQTEIAEERYLQVLELSRAELSPAALKRNYRRLAKKYHPDNYHDDPLADLAQEKMKEINEAYEEIQNQRKRGASGSGYGAYGGSYGGYLSLIHISEPTRH